MKMRDKITTLNRLVTANQDAAASFNDASSLVIDVDLRKYFELCSAHREKYSRELGHLLVDLNVSHAPSGTTMESLESTWMTIRGEVLGDSEEMVLNAMLEREEEFEEIYAASMVQDWSIDERTILARHLAGTQAVKRELVEWKDIIADTELRS